MTNSAVMTETYNITIATTEQAAIPAASPIGGIYTEAKTVTLTCATEGADIHYTLDGTAPTTVSAKYSTPISISATATLKAIAVKAGMTNSAVMTEIYNITTTPPGQVV